MRPLSAQGERGAPTPRSAAREVPVSCGGKGMWPISNLTGPRGPAARPLAGDEKARRGGGLGKRAGARDQRSSAR